MKKINILICIFFGVNLLACSAMVPASSKRVLEGYYLRPGASAEVLAVDNAYAFRFMERYRIGFNWLSGPGIRNCTIPRNVYRRLGGYGVLGNELNAPLFESGGELSYSYKYDKRGIEVSQLNGHVLGENLRGEFEKYEPFCSAFFTESAIGFGLLIIKPDSRKGTDNYIEGSVPVKVGKLLWLKKTISAEVRLNFPNSVPVEFWVLKIPETSYWLVLRFSINPGHTLQRSADDYRQKLAMFHSIVESVRLDPIMPIDFPELHK